MCPRDKLTRAQGIMEWPLFKKIVDNAVSCGVKHIFLGGFGEPLLDPYFIERIKYIKDRGLSVNTITNASLLNSQMSDNIITSGLDGLRISFYGLTSDVYELVHRGLSFNVTLANVQKLIEQKKLRHLPHPEISLSFLVLDENAHQAAAFENFWITADFVEIWRPHNYIDGRVYRAQAVKPKSCGRPWCGPLQVQWDGVVVPCCFDYNGYLVLGNLRDQSIEEVMHSSLYEELRQGHKKTNFDKFPYCGVCDQLNRQQNAFIFSNDPRRAPGRSNSNFFDFAQE